MLDTPSRDLPTTSGRPTRAGCQAHGARAASFVGARRPVGALPKVHCANPAVFFFFNDPATTEIYPLPLHDALPISLQQTAERRFQARRFEAERAGPALVDHSAFAADQVEAVGPSGIGLLDGIVHAIDEGREADPQSAHTAIGHLESFALGARIAEHDALANVAAHLPDVAGVCLLDIDGVEGDAIPVGIEQSIERGNLPAKGRSSVASE